MNEIVPNYLFIASIPVAWLAFSFDYSGEQHWLSRRRFWIFTLIPLVTIILAQTNDIHGLIWSKWIFVRVGDLMILHAQIYGTWFWINLLYTYCLLISGAGLILWSHFRSPLIYRQQATWVIAGALTPILVNGMYISHTIPGWNKDYSPIAFTLAGVFFAVGILSYRLLDLGPIARTTLIDRMSDGVIVLDPNSQVVDLNPTTRLILDRPEDSIIGQPLVQTLPNWLGDIVSQNEEERQGEITLECRGEIRHYQVRSLQLTNRQKNPADTLVTLHEISQIKRLMNELEHLARIDSLTGVYNRRTLIELAQNELDRSHRYKTSISVILIDVDNFKEINDTYGHLAGDQLLVAIAASLKVELRSADILARFGGDEFFIMLPETNSVQLQMVAERLAQQVFGLRVDYKNQPLHATIRLGIASLDPPADCTLDQLLECADRALYTSKYEGGNRVTALECFR